MVSLRVQKVVALLLAIVLFTALIWLVLSASAHQTAPDMMPVTWQRIITLPYVLPLHSSSLSHF